MSDRAAVIARALLDTLAEYLRDDARLHARFADLLRDELDTVRQELIAEIRLGEADTPDCPAPSNQNQTKGE